MPILINIAVSAIVAAATFLGIYNYLPLGVLGEPENLGTTITTINASDTLRDSRAVINTNFSELNTNKLEISTYSATTTHGNISSLPSLASVGTITTGTWSADAIAVSKGGTGTTSPSTYFVLLGNGANGITIASTTGTSGQFLTSNGAGAYPSWQTSSVNQGDAYTWTGLHIFNGNTTTVNSMNIILASTTASRIGVGTSTPSLANHLNVANNSYFAGGLGVGMSTTTAGGLSVSGGATVFGTASTSNLIISNATVGGPMHYTASSTSYSVSSGSVTYTGSIPTNANNGFGRFDLNSGTDGDLSGAIHIFRSGLTSMSVRTNREATSDDCTYVFSWSGANFTVNETDDNAAACSISGDIYWYK